MRKLIFLLLACAGLVCSSRAQGLPTEIVNKDANTVTLTWQPVNFNHVAYQIFRTVNILAPFTYGNLTNVPPDQISNYWSFYTEVQNQTNIDLPKDWPESFYIVTWFPYDTEQLVPAPEPVVEPDQSKTRCPVNTLVVYNTNGYNCAYYTFSNCVWFSVPLPTLTNTNVLTVYCCGSQLDNYPTQCQSMVTGPPFGPPGGGTNCLDSASNPSSSSPLCLITTPPNLTTLTNYPAPPPIPPVIKPKKYWWTW
jgi:hypothetical protein